MKAISASGIAIRIFFSLVLVILTFNPSGYSWFHWIKGVFPSVTPLIALSGIALAIGWVIYLRATLRSLGPIGLGLIAALFGCLLWLFVDQGWLKLDNLSVLSWIIVVLAGITLGIGMSWSHIRRRISGQADMDDVDE
jgi:uncharacterized membrane protein